MHVGWLVHGMWWALLLVIIGMMLLHHSLLKIHAVRGLWQQLLARMHKETTLRFALLGKPTFGSLVFKH